MSEENNPDPISKPQKLDLGIILPLFGVVLIIAIGGYQFVSRGGFTKIEGVDKECTSRAYAEISGPFDLIDQNGNKFTDKNLLGKPALVYFGYTYCPDICPTSLTYMGAGVNAVKTKNPKLGNEIQSVFITIDPERDTAPKMKDYVASGGFPTGLIGLTGNAEQIKEAAKQYKVGYKKVAPPNAAPEDYVMDHSSIIYMLDRKGKLATFFKDNTDPETMAKCIIAIDKNK